jgi:hypothetical protein
MSEPASEQEDRLMTRIRSWLALGALVTALAGGALWAADQKTTSKAQAPACCAEELGCCVEKCATQDKAKSCCADGKCCGCCEKGRQTTTLPLPIPAGSAVQLLIEPANTPDAACYRAEWALPAPPMNPVPPMDPVRSGPVCQPAPVQFTPATPYAQAPCVVPPPPVPAPWAGRPTPWRVCVVQEGGKSCLGMQVGVSKDTSAVCEGLTLKMGGDLKLAVAGKQVQVSGKCVKATADSVCWSAENGDILLDGSVKLKYECGAHKAEITAAQVVVGVTDGRIEVMGAGSITPQTLPVRTNTPGLSAPQRCPACPTTVPNCPPLSFWNGFFH